MIASTTSKPNPSAAGLSISPRPPRSSIRRWWYIHRRGEPLRPVGPAVGGGARPPSQRLARALPAAGKPPAPLRGDQVIIRVADDLHLGELAQGQLTAHVHPSINVWRVSLPA